MRKKNDTICPACGSAIPEDAPRGLCPTCVLEGAATVPMTTGTGRANAAPPSVEEIAPHFPDLEIIELLGAGGMGAVYKARQPQLDRTVAIKILSGALADDPTFVERFNREARVLARLSHPNIVTVFDFGTAGPYCYLLMEHIDGVNLRQAMRTGGFTPAESLSLVQEVCSALQFAHEEGILHRDIKPENVLIDSKGRVKIADFGIAKLVGEGEREDVTLTLQGSILGSPHYMAPEQIETPGDVDQRADIYSLGVVLYEMLTGELPIGRFALPSEKAAMDSRIDEIVLRTLEKERHARFQSAGEVMTQVGALADTPAPAPPAPAPVTSNDGSARFSLIAAILTGLSLLFAVLTLFLVESLRDRDVRTIATVIGLLLAGGSAIVGFILGAVALGDIRKSGGQKGGLGGAVFAVVVWPVLMIGMVSSLFLSMPMPDRAGGRSIGPLGVLLFMGLPQILAAVVMVRGLRRWAKGVPTADGGRRHPKLWRTALAVVGLTLLGPVLAEVVTRAFPSSDDDHPWAEMEREMRSEMSKAGISSSSGSWHSGDIAWFRGAPEAVLEVEVAADVRAELRLVRTDAEGTPEYAEIGTLKAPPGNTPIASDLKIGTSGTRGDGATGERGFTALLSTGESGVLGGESDFAGWEFDDAIRTSLRFAMPGNSEYRIANRRDGDGKVIGFLNLEVIVKKR